MLCEIASGRAGRVAAPATEMGAPLLRDESMARSTFVALGAAAGGTAEAGVAVGAAGSELLDYAKTLAHDAWSAQPGSQALTKVASGLDSSVRMGLGIPPSGDR